MKGSIERFLQCIEQEKRFSANTIIAYKSDLEAFCLFVQANYDLEDSSKVQPTMIRSWLARLMQQGYAKTSVNRKLSSLKSFFAYLSKNDLIEQNPMEKVRSVKKGKTIPTFVGEEKMELLLDNLTFPDGLKGARDRLVLELLYATGMRLSEICDLQYVDYDKQNQTIKVTGKRSKQRIIPLISNVADRLNNYLVLREQQFGLPGNGSILVTDNGKKIYPKFVYRLVRHYLSMVTSVQKRSPHVLRHTFATHMLNQGADLNAIKEILGHSNLSATQVYTHNSIDKIKRVYKQAHPKA